MISLDMKYTSLYWALRYNEVYLDIHTKNYNDYPIIINAEKQEVDYGNKIIIENYECSKLVRHKDFVILECVDRLLSKGYNPSDILLCGSKNQPDIIVGKISIYCEQWGNDYKNKLDTFDNVRNDEAIILYTSRLVSGLLEYKITIFDKKDKFNYGFFEDDIALFELKPAKAKKIEIENVPDINHFEIFEDEIVRYYGNDKIVKVPNGITTIGASAFWDCNIIEELILPDSLLRIGGDAFYYCKNLNTLTIPRNVWIMGNNPFAGCPNLELKNTSEHFFLENGILYNEDKTNLIHYTISKKDKTFIIPDSVHCLGKHCFYDCNNLELIVIPETVVKFENNPFSGCENLKIKTKAITTMLSKE
jgi:hypothetical protein